MSQVLALDVGGLPRKWICYEDAITYHAKNLVAWSLGEIVATFHGGTQRSGETSVLETTSIIAVKGKDFSPEKVGRVALSNKTLFARDRGVCAYCGNHYQHASLSRDHILPKSRGGKDTWTNCVTACRRCNMAKSDRLLTECNMQLLYVPYVPNHYEALILSNRHILTDQMDYLMSGVPKHSRVLKGQM
jgi:5-methylcytosine-specific restriction endonuclease McrA